MNEDKLGSRSVHVLKVLPQEGKHMRAALALVLGLVVGAGSAIWFYAHGGNIIVAGHLWGPALYRGLGVLGEPVNPASPSEVGSGGGAGSGLTGGGGGLGGAPSGVSGPD